MAKKRRRSRGGTMSRVAACFAIPVLTIYVLTRPVVVKEPPPVVATEPPAPVNESLYGDPLILGLETCAHFRASVPAHERRWAPAGLFNCGTNTLLKLMHRNCQMRALWQAPWGKHNPVAWRGDHWAPQFRPPKQQPRIDTVLPAMVIKDPLTWMKSMCRNNYEASFRHAASHHSPECPTPVDETATLVRFQPTKKLTYESLVHLWRDWNGAYLNVTFPRLIIRFEDLLFDTERTVTQVCECAGGTMRQPFRQEEKQSKDETAGHRGPVNDRDKALRLYGSRAERYKNYSPDDLAFIASVLADSSLVDQFHYGFSLRQARLANMTRR